jgi:F-box protein 9
MVEDTQSELERFRRQWKEEVAARNRASAGTTSSASRQAAKPQPARVKSKSKQPLSTWLEHEGEDVGGRFDLDDSTVEANGNHPGDGSPDSGPGGRRKKEPQSALEHYERAVEQESQGKLGESLGHYRKAFRVSPPRCCCCPTVR